MRARLRKDPARTAHALAGFKQGTELLIQEWEELVVAPETTTTITAPPIVARKTPIVRSGEDLDTILSEIKSELGISDDADPADPDALPLSIADRQPMSRHDRKALQKRMHQAAHREAGKKSP